MNFKNLFFVFTGIISSLANPSFASTTPQSTNLTPGQIEFIRQLDFIAKTNFQELAKNPAVIPLIKSASLACGNISLQKQAVYAAGGNTSQANYASNKFETLFCK